MRFFSALNGSDYWDSFGPIWDDEVWPDYLTCYMNETMLLLAGPWGTWVKLYGSR